MHSSTTLSKLGFSKAAATRSLSLICLVISAAVEWVPSFTFKSILNLPEGNSRFNFVVKHNPIKVANEQWGTVGTNSIVASRLSEVDDLSGKTVTSDSCTTFNSSKVSSFSGSYKMTFALLALSYLRCWGPLSSPQKLYFWGTCKFMPLLKYNT